MYVRSAAAVCDSVLEAVERDVRFSLQVVFFFCHWRSREEDTEIFFFHFKFRISEFLKGMLIFSVIIPQAGFSQGFNNH